MEILSLSISIGDMQRLIDKAKRLGYTDDNYIQIIQDMPNNDYSKIRIVSYPFNKDAYISEPIQRQLLTF